MDPLAYCLQLLAERRPLARTALHFAPAAQRAPLVALYALAEELARCQAPDRDPSVVQARLAWWQSELTARGAGQHPVSAALRAYAADPAPDLLQALLAAAWADAPDALHGALAAHIAHGCGMTGASREHASHIGWVCARVDAHLTGRQALLDDAAALAHTLAAAAAAMTTVTHPTLQPLWVQAALCEHTLARLVAGRPVPGPLSRLWCAWCTARRLSRPLPTAARLHGHT